MRSPTNHAQADHLLRHQQDLDFSPPPPTGPTAQALQILRSAPLDFKAITEGWLLNNVSVWTGFYHATNRLRMMGKRRGAKCVYEFMRYETAIRGSDPTVKLNNTYVSGLARLFNAVTGTTYFEVRT